MKWVFIVSVTKRLTPKRALHLREWWEPALLLEIYQEACWNLQISEETRLKQFPINQKGLLTWSDIWIRRCMAMDALNSECPTTKKSPFPCWLGNLDKSSTMDPIVWLYLELVHISLLWSPVIIKNLLYSFVRRQFTIILISTVHKTAGWARSYQYWIFLTNLILVFDGLGKFKGF